MRFRDRLPILWAPGFPAWFRTAFKDPSKACDTFWAIIHGWRAIVRVAVIPGIRCSRPAGPVPSPQSKDDVKRCHRCHRLPIFIARFLEPPFLPNRFHRLAGQIFWKPSDFDTSLPRPERVNQNHQDNCTLDFPPSGLVAVSRIRAVCTRRDARSILTRQMEGSLRSTDIQPTSCLFPTSA